jgi:hypothetical protein
VSPKSPRRDRRVRRVCLFDFDACLV